MYLRGSFPLLKDKRGGRGRCPTLEYRSYLDRQVAPGSAPTPQDFFASGSLFGCTPEGPPNCHLRHRGRSVPGSHRKPPGTEGT